MPRILSRFVSKPWGERPQATVGADPHLVRIGAQVCTMWPGTKDGLPWWVNRAGGGFPREHGEDLGMAIGAPHGWMSPEGVLHRCGPWGHDALARRLGFEDGSAPAGWLRLRAGDAHDPLTDAQALTLMALADVL